MNFVIRQSTIVLLMLMSISMFTKCQSFNVRVLSRKLGVRKPTLLQMTALDTKLESGRISAKDITLDTSLITQNPELVRSHLRARRADPGFIEQTLQNISELRSKRNALIVESDKYKGTRKSLSAEIGKLMKEKKLDEVEALKLQVQELNQKIETSDLKLSEYDKEIHNFFSYVPNLLDDRYTTLIFSFYGN